MKGVDGRNPDVLWLDCGNSMSAGQVVLGARQHRVVAKASNGNGGAWVPEVVSTTTVLPSVSDLFGETVDVALDAANDGPSCSLPEALRKQDLFTNRHIADAALNILWHLFRYGELEVHGAFINLRVDFHANLTRHFH
jgi:PRTRC genetic system ThiF family protein